MTRVVYVSVTGVTGLGMVAVVAIIVLTSFQIVRYQLYIIIHTFHDIKYMYRTTNNSFLYKSHHSVLAFMSYQMC